jgi:hypothetical protein
MATDAGMVAMAFDLVRLRPKFGCVSVHFALLGEFRLNRLYVVKVFRTEGILN